MAMTGSSSSAMNDVFTKILRAAGSWVGTPVGLIVLSLTGDWFLSTRTGHLIGLLVGPLLLLGMVLLVAGFFYVFRK